MKVDMINSSLSQFIKLPSNIQIYILFSASHYSENIDGLVQDCSNSSALAMELLQSCTKPSYVI